MHKPRSTAAEIKADIDRGLTGDKVAVEDPAAAPLGTDDEAGGTPTDPMTLAEERERGLRTGDQVRRAVRSRETVEASGALPWILIAAFLLAALAMVWLAAEYI